MSYKLTMADFQKALTVMRPSAKPEDVFLVPNTTYGWDDIGGLDIIRKKLNLYIVGRIRTPELYLPMGMTTAVRVLLVGPAGCGKTSVARALANEVGLNFMHIKGAQAFNKYVAESGGDVSYIFMRAESMAPCVLFFDEIDSICPKQSSGSEEVSAIGVTNQLLLEMSELEQRDRTYFIAATNKLDCLDEEFLRIHRMDTIYLGLPSPERRVSILKALTKNGSRPKLADDVDLDCLGQDIRCNCFSGADLGKLVRVASEVCLERIIESPVGQGFHVPVLNKADFEAAFESVSASVDEEAKKNFEAEEKRLEKRTA